MIRKILIILGHPARERQSFCEALARAYQEGAKEAGHEVHFIKITELQFDPILHEGYKGNQPLEDDIQHAQNEIKWAEHIVIVYPMWNYMIPALCKGFIERTFTQGFAYERRDKAILPSGLLKGKSVRLIQTMGIPAFIYRWFFSAHITKAIKNSLKLCGFKPINATYLGRIENINDSQRKKMLDKIKSFGSGAR